jgi:hypothetical protein
MKGSRRIGKLTVGGLGGVGLLVGLLLFIVLPAFAGTGGPPVPPPSTDGVTPTDVARGVPAGTDCSAFYASNPSAKPAYSYYIANPQSGTYSTTAGGTPVTFTLKQNPPNTNPPLPGYAIDKYIGFTSTNAAVTDVSIESGLDENVDIRGVNDTARYNYSGLPGGFVTSDGYLHPTALLSDKNGRPLILYSYSHVTFCFNLTTDSVSGTVYRDANQNGAYNPGTDTLQSGWTVNLYGGGTTPIKTATTGAGGTYSFTVPVSSTTTYKICEVPPAASGTWSQSQPGSGVGCTGAGELANGYSFQAKTPGATLGPDNFGNAQFASISGTAFSDTNGDGLSAGDSGLAGLTATLYNTTAGTSTTQATASDGTYTFANQVAGDSYTLCISTPTGTYKETLPASGASCTGSGQAAKGYTFNLATTGLTGQSFGLQPIGSISGLVYDDTNASGAYDTGTDTPQSGWTVDLYAGSTLQSTTTSASDGTFSFVFPLSVGTTYTVCEAPPSGTWAQSEPLPTSTDVCTGASELPKGHTFTAAAQNESDTGNFGNVAAVGPDEGNQISAPDYTVKLSSYKDANFVVNSGSLSSGQLFVSLWAGDDTQAKVPLVEEINWPFDPTKGQNQFTIKYTDVFPFNTANLKTMPFCNVDPRDAEDPSGLTLQSQFQDDANKGIVLPGTDTSCLITTTTTTTPASSETPGGTFTAYVFTDVDGLRTSG